MDDIGRKNRMQQVSLFDVYEQVDEIEVSVVFTRQNEEELKKAMASALIEIYTKGAHCYE